MVLRQSFRRLPMACNIAEDEFMPEINELSERELEILRLVATGVSNKEIAQKLYISTNTVKVHLRNIFSKIEVASRTEAAMFAVSNGLVPDVQSAGDGQPAGDPANQETYTSVRGGLFPATSIQVTTAEPDRSLFRPVWILVALVLVAVAFIGYQLLSQQQPAVSASPTQVNIPTPQARWRELSEMPTARFGLALAAYGNQIFAIGGDMQQGVTNVVERYDTGLGSWQAMAEKPTAVGDVSAAVLSGKIFVPGGKLADDLPTNVLEIYDPQRDVWSKGSPLPAPVSAYALAAFEGRLYLFGGWDGNHFLNSVYAYDPSTDVWTTLPSMPTARAYAGAAASGERIYVLGGRNQDGILNLNESLLPNFETGSGDAWSNEVPLPEGRYGMGVTSLAGFIYVVGGSGQGKNELSTLVFLPSNGTWNISNNDITQPVVNPGVVTIDAFLYSIGGEYAGKPVANNQTFQALTTIAVPIIR
jgi:DNA-binding CsgD family transcriptional regulator/N-acetylneuraminic acid mutarotase